MVNQKGGAKMIKRIINIFKKGGAKLGMVDEINKIVDHPRIAVDDREYDRIIENKWIYESQFPDVKYLDADGHERTRPFRNLNVTKVVARKLSKLIFNEGVTIESDNPVVDEFIKEVFENNKFRKNFGEELEAGYSIGGLAIRPYYDPNTNQIKISYAQADSFFPLQSNINDISEAVFVSQDTVTEESIKVYYTLYEFHTWNGANYVIENELYRSEKVDRVGFRVRLDSFEKYEELEPITTLENFTRPLFTYIKLAGKNNNDLNSPMSLGIIDNSKQQFRDINEVYDMFMHETKKSGRKIIASDQFFRTKFTEDGRPFHTLDRHDDTFRRVRTDNMDDFEMKEFLPSLRQNEFIEIIDFLLRFIEVQTGFSTGTFSFDGSSVKTATEVIAENSDTYSTRQDNVLIVQDAIRELIISMLELAESHDLLTIPDSYSINIDFDDGVFESKESKLEFYSKAHAGGFIPAKETMQRIFGVSEEEAKEWFVEIMNEQMGVDPMEQEKQAEEDLYGPEE